MAETERINQQIAWYESKSSKNKRAFHVFEMTEIVLAAAIPILSRYKNLLLVIALLGATIVILQAVQGLFKFHENWILYRSTAEALKHEKNFFESKAGPYSNTENPEKVLAERVEGLVSQEHAKWTSSQSQKKEKA